MARAMSAEPALQPTVTSINLLWSTCFSSPVSGSQLVQSDQGIARDVQAGVGFETEQTSCALVGVAASVVHLHVLVVARVGEEVDVGRDRRPALARAIALTESGVRRQEGREVFDELAVGAL